MPLYEYLCKKCGHRFERIQKFSDRIVKKCPECGGAVEQVISAPAVQFKGSGWYVTDYAKKSSASSGKSQEKDGGAGSGDGANSDSAKSEAGESKSESKTDSKSESKSESKKESSSKKPAAKK